MEHLSCTETAAQYEIPPSSAHLFLTMRPQSPIDPPLASISMFSSLVCQGKRLLCVYVCVCAYLHHHYYRSPHTSKCHYIFLANVFLGVTRQCLCVCVFVRALFPPLHACIIVYTCPEQVEHVSVTLCMWDQMWASLIAFPAVPEQVLREPALSPRVDKWAIFKEREEENDSGLSKPDKFPTNTPSLAAPTVQRAGGRGE